MDMDEVAAAYEQLIERFIQWAQTEDNIRAAVVIGSRARLDHPADEWSDLDILIFASNPEPYWATTNWLHHVGNPWLTFVEPTPDGNGFERRVLFEGGLDVDFVPGPVADLQAMMDQGFPPDIADIIHRGVRFLVDKDGFSGRLQGIKINIQSPFEQDPPLKTTPIGSRLYEGQPWLAYMVKPVGCRPIGFWVACKDEYIQVRPFIRRMIKPRS